MSPSGDSDYIFIRQLQLDARIGHTADERIDTQKITISLKIYTSTSLAAASKNLDDSICYLSIVEQVREHVASISWVLVEELAESLAGLLFASHSTIEQLEVTVEKFVIAHAESVGVTIQRTR